MKTAGANIAAARELLEALAALGVADVIICAGARNSPLVSVLEKTSGLRVHSFFEERSAAFFALGRARREKRPAAVLTTSGTAAAQLLPAAIEAFHTGVPLVLVTADRPRRLRGTGAPQAIDQTGLFAKFVGLEADIEAGENIREKLAPWRADKPLHANICFDEPLLDAPVETMSVSPARVRPAGAAAGALDAALQSFFGKAERPVAVVGTIAGEAERAAVEEFLLATRMPVYLEGTSGLRESKMLAGQALRAGDKVLAWGLKTGAVDGVLRIGGVPTARIWRDLDEPSSRIHVLSVSHVPFAGLSRGTLVVTDLSSLAGRRFDSGFPNPDLSGRDRAGADHLRSLFAAEPRSEPGLVHALSTRIPPSAVTYVGNSLPIREWDLAASFESENWIQANRGVNGIDGQTSTFLGLLAENQEGWCILGDLTTMYDLSAPWALPFVPGAKARFVVINNGGGKIFSRVFGSALFENRHEIDFSSWAKMWGLHFEKWSELPREWERPGHAVIELRPDPQATERFWNAYDAYWTSS